MRNTPHYQNRGYHILSDAMNGFSPIDGVAQFNYRGYQISMSTAGMSRGACHTKVAVYKEEGEGVLFTECDTVEEAIEFVNKETAPMFVQKL